MFRGIRSTRNGLQILESWSSESWLADFLLWNTFCFSLFQSKIWRKTYTIRIYYFKLHTKCKLCIWLLDSPLWWPEMQNVETRGHAHVRTILPDVSTMSPERGQLRAKKSTKDDWFYLREKAQREGRRCSVPEHAHLSSQPPGLPSLLAALGVQACGLQRHPMLARVPINQILLNGAPSRQLFQTALRNCGWETFKQYILFCHDTCYKWFPGSKQNSWRK